MNARPSLKYVCVGDALASSKVRLARRKHPIMEKCQKAPTWDNICTSTQQRKNHNRFDCLLSSQPRAVAPTVSQPLKSTCVKCTCYHSLHPCPFGSGGAEHFGRGRRCRPVCALHAQHWQTNNVQKCPDTGLQCRNRPHRRSRLRSTTKRLPTHILLYFCN